MPKKLSLYSLLKKYKKGLSPLNKLPVSKEGFHESFE